MGKRKDYSGAYKSRLRAEMIAAYGGVCSCCGTPERVFLELDHVYNDGAAHRRMIGYGASVWLDLKRRGWPRLGFRLMCRNCNWAVRFGPCPHERVA